MTDRGLSALAEVLDLVDVASAYRLSSISPPMGPVTLAAAILGERAVFLPEGLTDGALAREAWAILTGGYCGYYEDPAGATAKETDHD